MARTKRNNLTADQQRLVRAKALADRGLDHVREAIDECYRICVPHFDAKRKWLSDELTSFLSEQGFRGKHGRNWALPAVGYVLSGAIDKDMKRHEASLVAACVEMHRRLPSEAITAWGGRKGAIDRWEKKTGGYGNSDKRMSSPPARPRFEAALALPDEEREMPLIDVPIGLCVALETIDVAAMEVVIHSAFRADDPRPIVRAIVDLMRELPRLDETGDNSPTSHRYVKPLMAELRRRYGALSGLDPCAGLNKLFFNLMDEPKLFCEIMFGLDFLDYQGPRMPWAITNPPWEKALLMRVAKKAFETCDNVALLIKADPSLTEPLKELAKTMGYGLRTELRIPERYRIGGTGLGSTAGGMSATMFHWQLGHAGNIDIVDVKLDQQEDAAIHLPKVDPPCPQP